jgi:RNA polymerase sigma-70 factor (ECF subfamily)
LKSVGPYTEKRSGGNFAVIAPRRDTKTLPKPVSLSNREVYLCATPVDFYSFDETYLGLLQQGDRATQEHFVSYFSELLRIKLRSRMLAPQVIEDVRQETFLRVLLAVREGEIRQPERLGPYVNSVCKNVLLELHRETVKNRHMDLDTVDVEDSQTDLEGSLLSEERDRAVHAVLEQLPKRDGVVLRAVLEGRDKDEICRDLGVDRDYLRVLTHRAIVNFKVQYKAGHLNPARR